MKANQVGTATVDHRQLYVQEARAILENAPAYAERHGITETQAKKELIQQALLIVDRGWAEQTHITENDRARQALEAIAAQQTDKARDGLTRTPFNQVVHQNESDYFQADETAYNDSNLNAAEASAIEAGWAGEDNVLSRYATENGEKPLQVGFSDSTRELGSNVRQGVGAFYDAATTDPLGLAIDTVNNVYEDVVSCLTTSQCIAPDQTHGTARDRQLVAELQGNADAAVAEAADSLGTTLGELAAAPGVGKVAKTGVAELVDTAADQARKNARDWADDAKPAKIPAKKDVSPGLDVDGEMIGLDGPSSPKTTPSTVVEAEISNPGSTPVGVANSVGAGSPYHNIVSRVSGRILSESDALTPGLLGDDLTGLPGTFSGGRYATIQLDQPLTVYRAWTPEQSRELGAFWSLEEPAGSLQTRIDSALLPEWGNIRGTPFRSQAGQYTAIELPAGTTLHIGEVGSQGGAWVGGGSQLLIDGGAQEAWKIGGGTLK